PKTWSRAGKRIRRRKSPPGNGGAFGVPHEGVPGLSDSPPGRVREVQEFASCPAGEEGQELEPLRMLSHGLQRQEDRQQMLPPNRVSPAPSAEAGAAG
ncbi:MAG: hypothetical protein ACK56I_16040, partial [bacterium]